MGVALVNLIWRRMAVNPAALHWAWDTLKPAYTAGLIPAAAWSLRHSIALPAIAPFRSTDMAKLGLAEPTVSVIDAVLRTYERGNAQNLVALCALRRRLDADWSSRMRATMASAPVPADVAAEAADRVTEQLPPLPAMNALPETVQKTINSIAQTWVPVVQRGMIPSVFRHLGHWPALLTAFNERLQSSGEAGLARIPDLAERAIEQAAAHAAKLNLGADAALRLDADVRAWTLQQIALFVDAMIGPGVVIVPALRQSLPRSD